jgi:hypothetical protein
MFHLTLINFCDFQRLLKELMRVTTQNSSLIHILFFTSEKMQLNKQ